MWIEYAPLSPLCLHEQPSRVLLALSPYEPYPVQYQGLCTVHHGAMRYALCACMCLVPPQDPWSVDEFRADLI